MKKENIKELTTNQKKNLEILKKLRVQLAKDSSERLSMLHEKEKMERLSSLEKV